MLVVSAFELAGRLRGVLSAVAASFVLALGLQPPVAWLERRGWRRGPAAMAVLSAVGVAIVAVVAVALPSFVSQVEEIAVDLPRRLEELTGRSELLETGVSLLDLRSLVAEPDTGSSLDLLRDASLNVVLVLTVVIVTPSFAVSVPAIKRWGLRLLRREDRPEALAIVNEVSDRIAGYIAGNLLVSLIAGMLASWRSRSWGCPSHWLWRCGWRSPT